MKSSSSPIILENVEILDAGSEGMSIARINDQVIFVPFVVPGDVADLQITAKKRRYLEGRAVRLRIPSPWRIEPHCVHFGICGGCRWQNMTYERQLYYKQKQVYDNLTRIGKIDAPEILPILPSPVTQYYRNKLDFTFSNHRWFTEPVKPDDDTSTHYNALGFHVPRFFDKVVDIRECFHQKDPSNAIRNELRSYAEAHQLPFYDVRKWEGLMRNLIIRDTLSGGLMVILVFHHEDPAIGLMIDHLTKKFPQITSLFYVINPKKNDSLNDLEFRHAAGEPYITEILPPYRDGYPDISYRIGPASFFQTNSLQAVNLYRTVAGFADLTGVEAVYDLYTGTGTIANYLAPYAQHVTGIESVEPAVADAILNSKLNRIQNTTFIAGEAEKMLDDSFLAQHGTPDVIITDPPRNGMHEKVVRTILQIRPEKVVYVSCNPATQARDLALMSPSYHLVKCQPVDMFPHTQHVENVALLHKIK